MTNQRMQALQDLIQSKNWDVLLLEDPLSLLYLTGIHLSAGQLLISSKETLLIVDGRYIEAVRKEATCPVALRSDSLVKETLTAWATHHVAISSQDTTCERYSKLKELLPNHHIEPIGNPVRCQREVKNEHERTQLRQAAQLGSRGYDLVVQLLKEGVTEKEVALELELFWMRQGAKGCAFEPIIAFGPNTSKPHYRSSRVSLQPNQSVLIDIGVTLDDYHSDMTRVVFFGAPSAHMQEIYNVVFEAQQAALNLCIPGATIGDLDAAARDHITAAGYGDFFPHSLGHGIGLEVHEAPTIKNSEPFAKTKLLPGMAITIEPGIYLPDIGGVRIEDTILITDTGYEDLTQRSKELVIL